MKIIKKILEIICIFMLFGILVAILKHKEILNEIVQIITTKKIWVLISILFIFLIIHVLRMFRIYVLLIEEKIPLVEFVKIYIKTTFVNNIIPFKLGEFYKMICYGEKLRSFSAGLSLLWIDRFFDSIILLLLMSIASKFIFFSPIYVILVGFIIFSILLYTSFESTYKYFNTLILEKSKSKRSKIYLETIDEAKKIFIKSKSMLSFRGMPLILLSIIIWMFEYLLAYLTLEVLFNVKFGLEEFNRYINSSFFLFGSSHVKIFIFNISVLAIIFILIYFCLKIIEKGDKNEQ